MDASNLLKPMLARGELHTIGATTLDEYRKHIEKDAALERRFQPIVVDEPTVEDTISILRGLRERYEVHHGVRITDSALVAAATLQPPLHHRPLPARQGDRPRRRGGLAAADGDRLDAGRARRGRAAADPARDRAGGAPQGDRRRLEGPPRGPREGARRPRGADRRAEAALGGREDRDRRDPGDEDRARGAPGPDRAGPARDRLRDRGEAPVRDAAGAPEAARRAGGGARRAPGPRVAAPRGGHRRQHRRDRRGLDRRPGHEAHGGRAREARQDGGAAPPAASSARTRRSRPSPTPSAARGPASPIRTGRSARSSSSARPASARPSSPAPSPSSCSTTRPR